MSIPVFIIDTFTSEAFKGNPTAVCLINERINPGVRLSIANELNLPVTAFIRPLQSDGDYEISYFTPTTEIPACGHATLAAAQFVLINHNHEKTKFFAPNNIVISTVSEGDYSTLEYPRFELQDYAMTDEILESLKIRHFKSAGICIELEALFIELDDENLLKAIQPDFERMVKSNSEIKEIVVTCASSGAKYDFLLRSFCPWIGIDEDPVTGSVHSVLAEFWQSQLGKSSLTAYQASERGGEVYVTAYDDKVELSGKSVTVLKGELLI